MVQRDCYDYPQYWDLGFRSETGLELAFIEAACRRYARRAVRRFLEPGCGGGRLVVALAARQYDVCGFDINPRAVSYVARRLRRRGLRADVFQAEMEQFHVARPVDAAVNTFNTFRHLTSESAARSHLESVAAHVRPGGIYILGFHLLPPDADEEAQERWTARHGRTQVHYTLRVLECNRRRRIETIRFTLRVRRPGHPDLRLCSQYPYRLYTASQARRLLATVPAWELCDVFDFWYEIDRPLQLNNKIADTVFVLRRR